MVATRRLLWYELQDNPQLNYCVIKCTKDLVSGNSVSQLVWYWISVARFQTTKYTSCRLVTTLLAVLNSPLAVDITRILPHMKDEAPSPAGFIMEGLQVRLPDGRNARTSPSTRGQ